MANMLRSAPHVQVPGLLVPQVQSVDFMKYVATKTQLGSLAEDYLYITTAQAIDTESYVGQQWGEDLNKSTYALGQVQAPYYKISSYAEWDVQEQAKFEALSNGVALPDFLDNLAKQAINQRKHQAILFGFDNVKELNQGITANETVETMPVDSAGHDTLITYNANELQRFLSNLARKVMDASFNMTKPVVISSSVRVINYIRTALVPLTNYLEGGSVASVGSVYDKIVGDWLGVGKIEWVADNLLMAETDDGKDTIRLIAPGLDPQDKLPADVSQNLAGEFNSIRYNTFFDSAGGLMMFDAPPALGKYARRYDYKMTPGINLRHEAVISTSIKYA